MTVARGLAAAAIVLLAGCGSSGTVSPPAGGQRGPIRAEAACNGSLSQPLRQTLILVDSRALHKAADGIEFARTNTAFRDLILSIADPLKAIESGASVPRERVTIAVVPADGSPAETSFTGCLPGLSPEELAAATKNQSALSSAFAASPAGKMQKDAEEFEQQLIGGMVTAASRAESSALAESGEFDQSHFLQGVRASRTLFDTPGRVQRVILIADLSNLTIPAVGDPGKRFAAGVEAGRRAGGDLGRAELYLIAPTGRTLPDGAFLRGYFLAQSADLAATAAGRFAPTADAPERLWAFTGDAAYPSGPQLVDVRIGQDKHGRLTSSWLTLLIDPRYPIPLGGQMVCASEDRCRITSDNGGFAQQWAGAPADVPRFDRDLPFGGMRNFAMEITGAGLSGKVYDDAVYLGDDQHNNSIAIRASAKH